MYVKLVILNYINNQKIQAKLKNKYNDFCMKIVIKSRNLWKLNDKSNIFIINSTTSTGNVSNFFYTIVILLDK